MGGKLFNNKFLSWLTLTHPALIIPLDILIIAAFFYIADYYFDMSILHYWWMFLAGIFAWTLIEYLMHRYAFHFHAKNEKGRKVIYMLHGIHHDHPHDPDALYQPPITNFLITVLLFGVFYIPFQNLSLFFTPGLVAGYLMYSSVHFTIHKFKPPFKWIAFIWRNHNLHHYRYPNKGFGVSSPLWDYVFGTVPPREIEDKSTPS